MSIIKNLEATKTIKKKEKQSSSKKFRSNKTTRKMEDQDSQLQVAP